MGKITIHLLVGVAALSLTAWAQQHDPRLVDAITRFYEAIDRGNALARVELLDDDVFLMPNGSSIVRGKTDVGRVFTADTATTVFRIKDRTLVEVKIDGNLAYTVNTYFYTWHAKGDPPKWRKTKNVHIWRKDAKGEWKLHLDIWNSDEPIAFRGS